MGSTAINTGAACCIAGFRSRLCPLWVIRVGHDREDTAGYVRFAPKADKRADVSLSPLSAISGLTHRSKKAPLFGHLVGIRLTGVTEHWIGTAALVRLDVGGPDDLGPLFDLVGNEFSEFGGCQ